MDDEGMAPKQLEWQRRLAAVHSDDKLTLWNMLVERLGQERLALHISPSEGCREGARVDVVNRLR